MYGSPLVAGHTVLTVLVYGAVPAWLDSVQVVLYSCREVTSALAEVVPENQLWRWKESWSISLRNAVFSALMVEFLSLMMLGSIGFAVRQTLLSARLQPS